jgi:hypothetical protein
MRPALQAVPLQQGCPELPQVTLTHPQVLGLNCWPAEHVVETHRPLHTPVSVGQAVLVLLTQMEAFCSGQQSAFVWQCFPSRLQRGAAPAGRMPPKPAKPPTAVAARNVRNFRREPPAASALLSSSKRLPSISVSSLCPAGACPRMASRAGHQHATTSASQFKGRLGQERGPAILVSLYFAATKGRSTSA